MIEWSHVSVAYERDAAPVLRDVDLRIDEGELVLLAGHTGTGKSTFLRTINGLMPHFTGGHVRGEIRVAGHSTAEHTPRELAHLVGLVGQDPLAGFVTDTVEEELAYGMEQLGIAPQTMRRRVEETLDLLGIADLRHRALRSLSGGEQQRVAIGSILTMHPQVVVLDEPTSALDPTAAEDVLATIARLVHDLGTTVVVAEHRMERVVPFADTMLFVRPDGTVDAGAPRALLPTVPIAPPVVELGRLLGVEPLPLTVREARRQTAPLRERLGSLPARLRHTAGQTALQASDLVVRHGDVVAVRDLTLSLRAGEVTALMGRNGSGKSSLLWALQGSGSRAAGTVEVDGQDPADLPPAQRRARVGLVPQTASDLLYLETVAAECAMADRQAGVDSGTCQAIAARLAPTIDVTRHPRDLSEGQRLALVLAVQLTAAPSVMLLDEPTRGLDYTAKAALAQHVGALAEEGRSVVVATHDVEFVALVADRALVMAEGEVVADGPAPEVLGASPAFAPQVAKVLGPPWLTVAEVRGALDPSEAPR